MSAVFVTSELHRVPVLLGGSGLARLLPMPALRCVVPALFLPKPRPSGSGGNVCAPCALGG